MNHFAPDRRRRFHSPGRPGYRRRCHRRAQQHLVQYRGSRRRSPHTHWIVHERAGQLRASSNPASIPAEHRGPSIDRPQCGPSRVYGRRRMLHWNWIDHTGWLQGWKGSVVAAGSLLPPGFEVPPGSVAMGSPARIKKKTGDNERATIEHGWVHYVELAAEYFKASRARPQRP